MQTRCHRKCCRLANRYARTAGRGYEYPGTGASPRSFVWGGGGRIHGQGTQTHLPPKSCFSSDFGHFILKMLENVIFAYVSRKKILKYHNFWGGRPPLIFRLRGTRPPPHPPPMPRDVTKGEADRVRTPTLGFQGPREQI